MLTTPALFAVASGLALGLGLIVAIGAQNAFVLRQGLRLEHVAAVVAVCVFSDLALMARRLPHPACWSSWTPGEGRERRAARRGSPRRRLVEAVGRTIGGRLGGVAGTATVVLALSPV